MYLRDILKTSSAEEAEHILTILNTQRALSRRWVTNTPKTPSKEGISRPPFQRMAQFFSPLRPQVTSNCGRWLLIFSSRRRIRISPQKWGGGRGRWTLCRARIRCKMLKLMVVLGLLSPADSRGARESCLVKKSMLIPHNWKTFPFSDASVNVVFPLGNDVFLHFRGSAHTLQHVINNGKWMPARKKAEEKIAGEILVPPISPPPSDCPIAMTCGLRLQDFKVTVSTFLNACIMCNPSPSWRKYRAA